MSLFAGVCEGPQLADRSPGWLVRTAGGYPSLYCCVDIGVFMSERHVHRLSGLQTVWTAAGVYALVLSFACYAKYVTFGYDDFDLAVHSQSVWGILHGNLHSSILSIPFLGNHFAPILLLIAPLYIVFPSPVLLLVVQSAVLAFGSVGIYLFGRRRLPESWAVAIALLYLVYPPLLYMNMYEFHPIALATTALIFALYFYEATRFLQFMACCMLGMMCQENVSLVVAAFGLLSFVDRRRMEWMRCVRSLSAVQVAACDDDRTRI